MIQLIKLAADYVRPVIKESMSKEWVMNGEDNRMYKDIINSYYGSATNSAIIDSYSRFIFGKGLNIQQDFISKKDLRKICADLVMFGEASIEILKDGNLKHADKSKILPAKAKDGKIESYWYSFDWADLRKYPAKEIKAFGYGQDSESQIYIISSYQIGQFYFNNPSYISALPYCELESELANYYVNHLKNGLSFGHVINVNGGKPESEEDIKKHSQKIRNELTGSTNAGKFLLSFNNNKEEATTVEALEVSNAHEQYTFLTQEAQDKICVAHKVVSGAILGINKASGFSSTADEIEVAFNETYINVIQPMQELLVEAIEQIKGISNLDFIPLRFLEEPISSNDSVQPRSQTIQPAAAQDKEASYNGAQISSSLLIMQNVKDGVLTTDQAITFLIQMLQFEPEVAKALFAGNAANEISLRKVKKKGYEIDLDAYGEDIDLAQWELLESAPVDYENEDETQNLITSLNEEYRLQIIGKVSLASAGTARPNSKSEIDGELFKSRYRYSGNQNPERSFCKLMMSKNKLYRKEDIDMMSMKNVNPGFGMAPSPNAPYDIWAWKGGGKLSSTFRFGTCKHFWVRETYLLKADVNNPLAERFTAAQARKAGEILPTPEDKRGYIAPHDM
jgi:hypothetical protein